MIGELLFVAAALQSTVVATPTPAAPPGWVHVVPGNDGEHYPVVTNPVYFMFAPRAGHTAAAQKGFIASYGISTERDVKYPSAYVVFFPDGKTGARLVELVEPIRINGRTYACSGGKSAFERRYRVCPSLPQSVMGARHRVRLKLFRAQFPDGAPVLATAVIDSAP